MYCPQCLTEYREGFRECADCRVPLAEGVPPAAQPDAEQKHDLALVTVLETDDTYVLAMARGALDEAGIDYMVACDEHGHHPELPTAFPTFSAPIACCWCRVQVAADCETQARELLEPLQKPDPLEAEAAP
ncbi:MAG: DUF2007 domain-containing protein [Acidobacteriia bacterium]|nr:DUF2007 domain-containing protein [Terriglobia bacterium]